jgi:FkbM family methyltransferase
MEGRPGSWPVIVAEPMASYDAPVRERLIRYPFIARLKPSAYRAAHTARPARFFARETAARGTIGVYGLRRASRVRFALRHGTPDAESFDQIFCQEVHDAPEPAVAAIRALGRPPRVLDLGANIGLFAAWAAARWPGAEITCVEPDPGNLAVLHVASQANGGAWRVVDAAAGTAPGELRFHAGLFAVSRAALPGEDGADLLTVPVVDALELATGHDVLKLDIEGGEWEILADPRLAELPLAALTLEYHPHLCPVADTHGHAIALLSSAGFEVRRVPHAYGAPPDDGALWAWRA